MTTPNVRICELLDIDIKDVEKVVITITAEAYPTVEISKRLLRSACETLTVQEFELVPKEKKDA